jgi:hypothetical protein
MVRVSSYSAGVAQLVSVGMFGPVHGGVAFFDHLQKWRELFVAPCQHRGSESAFKGGADQFFKRSPAGTSAREADTSQ